MGYNPNYSTDPHCRNIEIDVQVWFASKPATQRMHEEIIDDLNVVDFLCPD